MTTSSTTHKEPAMPQHITLAPNVEVPVLDLSASTVIDVIEVLEAYGLVTTVA